LSTPERQHIALKKLPTGVKKKAPNYDILEAMNQKY
jgi:hypothetical protein